MCQLANRRFSSAFTLAEILIALAILGLVSTLLIQAVFIPKTNSYGRSAEDFVKHLGLVYNRQKLMTGSPPSTSVAATTLAGILPAIDSMTVLNPVSPETLTYSGKMIVYLKPEQCSGSACNSANLSDPILAGTSNREWLLLDINGTENPNAFGDNGDRVLLNVNNTTGDVQTAWQRAAGTGAFARSFYDVFKGY
ncbi:MAG: prepilin-type N-terminal cleavage/methylation domain-containing protein [Vampirovibrionales bacterium]|nr:prepilin-type N-terminal cleavage/methylation domain-containing protein [Vampirovibrionales bacterium]